MQNINTLNRENIVNICLNNSLYDEYDSNSYDDHGEIFSYLFIVYVVKYVQDCTFCHFQ